MFRRIHLLGHTPLMLEEEWLLVSMITEAGPECKTRGGSKQSYKLAQIALCVLSQVLTLFVKIRLEI